MNFEDCHYFLYKLAQGKGQGPSAVKWLRRSWVRFFEEKSMLTLTLLEGHPLHALPFWDQKNFISKLSYYPNLFVIAVLIAPPNESKSIRTLHLFAKKKPLEVFIFGQFTDILFPGPNPMNGLQACKYKSCLNHL